MLVYVVDCNISDRELELEKEKKHLESEIKRVEGKLNNKGFTEKAPAAVVEELSLIHI